MTQDIPKPGCLFLEYAEKDSPTCDNEYERKYSMKKKTIYKILLSVTAVLLSIFIGFLVWAGRFYRADATAKKALEEDATLRTEGNLTILTPEKETDIGIIFYPGAKVEAVAYMPLLEELKDAGYVVVLVKMPLNMALFNVNAAEKVYDTLPTIRQWYIAGHSMGGAMASSYASKNPDKVEGLILMGAYVYGSYPCEKALTIYGSYNDAVEKKISYTENIVKIEGGNHAQFGNYGKQKGDHDADISAEEQQRLTVEAVWAFIGK